MRVRSNIMNNETIELNKTTCSKCDGDGKNFKVDAHEFFRRWRKQIGAQQNQVSAVLKIENSQLSKFENGQLPFSEKRMRKLAEILSNWQRLQVEASK